MNFTKLEDYLGTLEQAYGVHGFDIKIMCGHRTLWRHVCGHRDYEQRKPVTDRDLYNVYSASKVITATAGMQLVEQGKLGLDDEVEKYLPEFSNMKVADHFELGRWPIRMPDKKTPVHPAKKKILIRQLFSMTSGMSYDVASEWIKDKVKETNGEASTREMMSALAQMPLLFEPGEHYAYALGHDVLAAVIEVISGMTFGEYLRKNIFAPLDMHDIWLQEPEDAADRLSAQYIFDMETNTTRPDHSMIYRLTKNYECGGAGICTTVDDYSRFLDALANEGVGSTGARILKPETIRLMTTNQLTDSQLQEFQMGWKTEYGYALGVRTLIDNSKTLVPIGEFGWDGAAGAYALIDPINHISITYAQEVLGMLPVYMTVHPKIRDLAYEGIFRD
ncbi:MAG: beta-lactamase family protein [Lachnospiraceae bacterium]|nr:beta-lactamase family protein [Lachnospiraceae bacterium]